MANLKIKEFANPSGVVAFRVQGTIEGSRIRENFPTLELAEKRLREIEGVGVISRKIQTTLTDDEIKLGELASREFPFREIIEAGVKTLSSRPRAKPIDPLVEEFIAAAQDQTGTAWLRDLRTRLRSFSKANPGALSTALSPSFARSYLAGIPNAVTRRNYRSALSRWGSWLVERGYLTENFCVGIKIRVRQGEEPPGVLSVAQARALMAATADLNARRVRGWLALGLYAGLRPAEASRLTWGEVDFDRLEINVLGRKRGSMPRIIKIHPIAAHWLKMVKADGASAPGYFSVRAKVDAVKLANLTLPESGKLTWSHDVLRHSYASYRAASGVSINELAVEMGNSARVIYRHYRQVIRSDQAAQWWAL